VLDVAALAADRPRECELGSWNVSPNNKQIAFTVDFHGNREFRIFVRTLPTGPVVDEGIENAASTIVFAGDSETFHYIRNDKRSARISFGAIGSAATRRATCFCMRRKTQLLAFRSLFRSRGNLCF